MAQLALVRHGQSEWNLENRFTGWVDVDLTEKGLAEADRAGELLTASGAEFEACFTSLQKRAIRTLWRALDKMDRMWLPVTRDWRLNERHYGGLTGLDKKETAEKHGDDQVKIWRRSYDTPPPPMAADHPDRMDDDLRYRRYGVDVPAAESLSMTVARTGPYFDASIAPLLKDGKSILIAAHGNSLRAIVKVLFEVNEADIVGVEIPTGNPLLIDLAPGTIRPTAARYLDEERAQALPPAPGA